MERIEILTGRERRRRWSNEQKLEILRGSWAAGARVAEVARAHGISRQQIYQWRLDFRAGRLVDPEAATTAFVPVEVCDGPSDRASSGAPLVEIGLNGGPCDLPGTIADRELQRLIRAVEAA
jgi:transposase